MRVRRAESAQHRSEHAVQPCTDSLCEIMPQRSVTSSSPRDGRAALTGVGAIAGRGRGLGCGVAGGVKWEGEGVDGALQGSGATEIRSAGASTHGPAGPLHTRNAPQPQAASPSLLPRVGSSTAPPYRGSDCPTRPGGCGSPPPPRVIARCVVGARAGQPPPLCLHRLLAGPCQPGCAAATVCRVIKSEVYTRRGTETRVDRPSRGGPPPLCRLLAPGQPGCAATVCRVIKSEVYTRRGTETLTRKSSQGWTVKHARKKGWAGQTQRHALKRRQAACQILGMGLGAL